MFEETIMINEHTVKIKYSEEKHPEIVSTMRDTLERSKKVPKMPAKFDTKGQ